jgi:hypothetical protein
MCQMLEERGVECALGKYCRSVWGSWPMFGVLAFGVLVLGFAFWVGFGFCVLGSGFWVFGLGLESLILGSAFWVLGVCYNETSG